MNSLRRYGVDTSYILRGGDRIGLYYSEKGASQRADQVIYDRKYSAFSLSREDEYAWDEIFNEAKWFHFTGITPALGENCFKIAERAAKETKLHNAIVSCDVNYRKGLWNIKQARAEMERLLAYTDVCIANESQISEIFGLPGERRFTKLYVESGNPQRIRKISYSSFRRNFCTFLQSEGFRLNIFFRLMARCCGEE